MHRRKDLWGPDADQFDPDRFIDERVKKYLVPNPYIFIPFNAGPRICLGQQVSSCSHRLTALDVDEAILVRVQPHVLRLGSPVAAVFLFLFRRGSPCTRAPSSRGMGRDRKEQSKGY